MKFIWKAVVIFWIYSPFLISSISIDSLYLDFIQKNISDFISFNNFYRDFLKDVRYHRSIDTVSSPINVDKIRSKMYDEEYLKNACYETASDLLIAHGYNKTDLTLSSNDIQSLLPAILNTVENPGCARQLPPLKQHSFFNGNERETIDDEGKFVSGLGWVLGLVFIVIMKVLHLIIFFVAGDHSSAFTSSGISKSISDHVENMHNSPDDVRFPPIKYHLWLGLGFNAFTCGIILGTIIYHLIPHIYEIPNEDFEYTYLLRGTVVLCGVFLFFIVEKLLRFRFKVDEMQFDEAADEKDEAVSPSDTSMIQMAKMHGTFHVHKKEHSHHKHPESPIRLPSNVDSGDEETTLQAQVQPVKNESHSSHHHHDPIHGKHPKRNIVLYHIIYDFSNDIIYGCGLATAVAHDRLIGLILGIMIFSEGLRRHSQLLSALGRKLGFAFLFISIVFLVLGYMIGGILIQKNQQFGINTIYIQKEYIYSIVYGALFYTALVTLIPELNDFGQHLQTVVKTGKQTSKQRRLLKALILICQNLFLIIGVLIALVLAIIWRYYHRINIYKYVCIRDPYRQFCHS